MQEDTMKDVITVRLDPEVRAGLEKLAKATARTRSFLVADAVREYLRANDWQIEAVQEGVRQADEGRLIPHEKIRKKWEKKLAHSVD
jgi:RHH-type rel operon transcriptional repressor/antitoxin RelB